MNQSEEKGNSDPSRIEAQSAQGGTEGVFPNQEPQSKFPFKYLDQYSPGRVFSIAILAIFFAEILAMLVVYHFQWLPYWLSTLLDGLIMIVIIFPILYYLLFRSLIRQITERKRGEALLGNVLEILPVGVAITDPNGQILHGNPAFQQIWGGARYVGIEGYGEYKSWWADSGKRIESQEWAAARAINRRETSLDEEIEIETFEGTRKIVLNSALPILDEKDLLQGAIIVNQEITQHRQMERELIEKNVLLERFFLSIDTLIAYMDRDFNFIRVNEAYASVGGHPPEFYTGKNHFALYPSEENRAIFQRVVESGVPFSVFEKPFEYTEFPERGVTYWDWSLHPVCEAAGEVEGLVFTLVDVTERKRAQIQLARQNQELLELSRAEHRQRELAESLTQATIALGRSLELDEVLRSILEQIRKHIPFQGGDVVLLEGETIRVGGFLGFEDHPEGLPAMERSYAVEEFPLLQQVCRTLQPVNIDSVAEHPDWRFAPGMEWVRSHLTLPLVIGSQAIGIINLNSDRVGAFSQESVERLLAFAAPAALALRNAQIYKAELIARQAAEILRASAQALTHTLELDERINSLLDHICAIVPSDTASVALLEGEMRLGTRIMRGFERWAETGILLDLHLDFDKFPDLFRLIATQSAFLIPDSTQYPPWKSPSWVREIRSWLIAPIVAGEKVIGIVGLGKLEASHFTLDHLQWVETLVGQAAVAIQNAWLFDQVRSSSERLQSLARKLVEIQEKERYHIARELHDEAGQVLSSLKLGLGILEQDPECPPRFRQRLSELKIAADGVLEELHRLAMDLRPAALDHVGLVAALEQYAREQSSDFLTIQFKAVGFDGVRLPRDVETALYRIVQEALTNVVRHSQAANVGILVERGEGQVKVFVEDDGIGFAPDLIESSDRLGLVGMRERAEMFGGTLTVESAPDIGTSIIVEVPDGNSYPDRR